MSTYIELVNRAEAAALAAEQSALNTANNKTIVQGLLGQMQGIVANTATLPVPSIQVDPSTGIVTAEYTATAGNVLSSTRRTGTLDISSLLGSGQGSTTEFYKCVSVDTTNHTWTGYKATLVNGFYVFDITVTSGLSYSDGFVPIVGRIYDGGAKVEVSTMYKQPDPITTNDADTLIYLDGTTVSNQAAAASPQSVSIGGGVTASDGVLHITHDSSGRITTTANASGFGGTLARWTWDFFFTASADFICLSGHSDAVWCLQSYADANIQFRGSSSLGVMYTKNTMIGLSLQYDEGTVHVWSSGVYVGSINPNLSYIVNKTLGLGCDGYNGNYDRMVDTIKLLRFSRGHRYIPGVNFSLPSGFTE